MTFATLLLPALLTPAFVADQTGSPVLTLPSEAELRDVHGNRVTLGEAFGGPDEADAVKAAVVVFVGTECPLVQVTAPRLRSVAEENRKNGVRLVLVDANRQDSLSDLAEFRETHDFPSAGVPVLKDPGNELADALRAERTPEVLIFGPAGTNGRELKYRGRISDQYGVGYARDAATRDDFGLALASVLKGEAVEVPKTEVVGCKIGRTREADPNAAVTWASGVDGQPGAGEIIFENCAACHRPGEAAPFALLNYEEAAGWGPMLAEVVTDKRMPPWYADPAHGVFSNDARLSDDEKDTLLSWVKAGCPEGDPADAPEPPQVAEGWRIGEPDLIVEMADEPTEIPAEGVIKYRYFQVDPGFTEDKYVIAAEPRPGNPEVVHHIIVRVVDPKARRRFNPGDAAIGYAPGLPPMQLKPGQAYKIAAGSRLVFEMHYTANGQATTDLSRVGFKFLNPETVGGVENLTLIQSQAVLTPRFEIPPHEKSHTVVAERRIPVDLTVMALTPHMHYRGASFKYELTDPDGETTVLLDVPAYDFNWQLRYDLKEPIRVKRGSTITCTATYDNSADNPHNPDPTQAVRWGDQSDEEMMIGFLLVAFD
ncbi:MAG: redoxin domain-containing protein [Planctomycetota bacterium]